jgi:PAS domain-containing protein
MPWSAPTSGPSISGTELRIVVTAQIVQRVLSLSGLDRLVSIYPSLEAATAARAPAAVIPVMAARPEGPAAAITPAVVGKLLDALQDGVALTDDGGTLALANLRLEEMFGYEHAELIGRPVESLVPADLQAAHRGYRAAYAQAPRARRCAPEQGWSRCARTRPRSRPRSASAR